MPRLNWGDHAKRFFETGLDRGVLYPKTLPEQGPILATNLFKDPGLVTDEYLNLYASTILTTEVEPYATLGSTVKRAVAPAAGVTAGTLMLMAYPTPAVPGTKYSFRIRVRATPNAHGKSFRFAASTYNSGAGVGPMGDQVITTLSSMFWKSIDIPNVSRPSSGGAFNMVGLQIIADEALASGEGFEIDGVSIVVGPNPVDPFSGAGPNTGVHEFSWTGEEYDSTSVKREILSNAVPWVGLASVDEEGAESGAAYYIDGRPFLFLPKPKEFKATLAAWTYPDEFAAIMGEAEATDGLYLDSQMGEAFDLSYRTIVGNGTDGSEHGYKIHIVYNATVAPQGKSYSSLGEEINPVEFSWEIQAVPVPIEGYRPTAHIMIDTRHMDKEKLAEIEAMLYGSEDSVPHIPSPQTVFDTLHHGGAIVIIDNGDGTWEAQGSYKNIYMIGDGVFEIDNVDATIYGDGTYEISSTP